MVGFFLQMKNKFLIVLLSIVILCLSACSPRAPEDVGEPGGEVLHTLYICGAVETDGYFQIASGNDYFFAINQAVLLPQGVYPDYVYRIVDGQIATVIVPFHVDGVKYDSINVNGMFVLARLPVDGVDEQVINALADYIEQNGKISNRNEMKLALGNFYNDNYYKFYVSEGDYEID